MKDELDESVLDENVDEGFDDLKNEDGEGFDDLSQDDQFVAIEVSKEMIRISKEITINTKKITKDAKFIEGMQEGLMLAGFFNALISCGISVKMAEELTMNKQTGDTNRFVNTATNNASIQIAKTTSNQIKDMTL